MRKIFISFIVIIIMLTSVVGLTACESPSYAIVFEAKISKEIDGNLVGEWQDTTKFGNMNCGTTYRIQYKCIMPEKSKPIMVIATFDRAKAEPVLGANTFEPKIDRNDNETIATFEVTKSCEIEFKIMPFRTGEDIVYQIKAQTPSTAEGYTASGYLSLPLVFTKGQLFAPILRNLGNGTIEWAKVPFANMYEVWLNNGGKEFTKIDTIITEGDGPFTYKPSGVGTYEVYVIATSDAVKEYTYSEESNRLNLEIA